MSNTMNEFNKLITDIEDMKKQQVLIIEKFATSTGELKECFKEIISARLNGYKHCSISVDICPELYAKELAGMGFEVIPVAPFNEVENYIIKWN